jgi:hypothetical protein
MEPMKGRLIGALVLAAACLVLSWSVSFAAESGGAAADPIVQVVPVDGRPVMTVYRGGIASVTPGDLYIIDARDVPNDLPVALHLVNAGELATTFRYTTFRVGVWRLDDSGVREPVMAPGGAGTLEAILSLLNGNVSFILPGGGRYVVGIDGGSYAAYPAGTGGATALPEFVLTTD